MSFKNKILIIQLARILILNFVKNFDLEEKLTNEFANTTFLPYIILVI